MPSFKLPALIATGLPYFPPQSHISPGFEHSADWMQSLDAPNAVPAGGVRTLICSDDYSFPTQTALRSDCFSNL